MSQIFNEEDLEAVFSIDASNAFSAVNPDLFLHNVRVACPEIAIVMKLLCLTTEALRTRRK